MKEVIDMTKEELKKKYEELMLYYDLGPWWERDEQEEEKYEECKLIFELLKEPKPSDNCISRDTAIRLAEQGQVQGFEWQLQKLMTLPPVTPTRKKGKWIIIDDCEKFIAKCSECGRIEDSRMISEYPYCHCGAEMEIE